MGDNESDVNEMMVGDGECTFIIGDNESEDMEMLVGVIKRVTVMGEVDEGGEGVSRPDGNSAGSAQRL